ncbi:MAG: hypothetical protein ACXWX7_12365 [Candidatus Binatia bacterium]
MSERNETFVKRCRAAIVEIADSAELERYLRAVVAEEFPVVTPGFIASEPMPMLPRALRALPEETLPGGNYAAD